MMPRLARLLLCSLVLLIACAGLPLRGASPEQLEQRFKEAGAKFEAGEPQAALEIYNEILEAEPAAGNVWVMRAVVKWSLKDRSGARADLAQALKLHPDNLGALRVRAQLRYDAGEYSQALADLDRAIAIAETPGDSELFAMRGETRRRLSDSAGARQDLDRAIELNPDYEAALYVRGELLEQLELQEEAERDYARVVALNPQHAEAWNQLSWLRFYAQDWDAAIEHGRRVIALAPESVFAWRMVGYAQFGRGNFAEAALTLTKAADLMTDSEAAFSLFIRHAALIREGKPDDRLARSWPAWKAEPWLQALGQFLTGTGSEEALEAVASATEDKVEQSGRACEMHFYIGLKRLQAGDRSTARLRFQSAVSTNAQTYIEHALAKAELARRARPSG